MSNKFSQGPIENFSKGWAIIPFEFGKVHYYRPVKTGNVSLIGDGGQVKLLKSLCGIERVYDNKRPPLGGGDFDQCKRCQAKLRRL